MRQLTERGWGFSPSPRYCVDVGATDAAAFNFHVDVIVAEDFGFELGTIISC